MKKLILILVLAFGAALAVPATRPRVLALLRPVTKPILDPVLGWSAKGEMARIARDLESTEEFNGELPSSREFSRWLAGRYSAGQGDTDPWGSHYYLRLWSDSFVVGSPGPDLQMGTEDDILVSKKRRASRR